MSRLSAPAPAHFHARLRWLDLFIAITVILGASFIALQIGNKSYDDAYITFRYAKNVALGHGFNYNTGQTYLGTTTPLLSLALAALARLTSVDFIPIFAQWLTAFSLMGLSLFSYLYWRDRYPIAAVTTALLTLCQPALVSLWGGESLQLLCLLMGGFYFYRRGNKLPAYVLLSLAYLTRSEGGLALILVGCHDWYSQRKFPMLGTAIGATLIGAWSLFAYLTFGSPFPGTLGAKIAQMRSGLWAPFLLTSLDWARSFALRSPNFPSEPHVAYIVFYLLAAVGAIAAVWRRSFHDCVYLVWVVLYALGYHLINVPFYPWYALPIFFAFVLMAGFGTQQLYTWLAQKRWPALKVLPLIGALFALVVTATQVYQSVTRPMSAIQRFYTNTGVWLHDHVPATASVGYFEIGFIGYYSDRTLIDAAGLINPDVAAHIAKKDFKWVYLRYQPDYILINAQRWYDRLGSIRDEAWFAKAYRPIAEIAEPGYTDSPITVYQKVDASQIPAPNN